MPQTLHKVTTVLAMFKESNKLHSTENATFVGVADFSLHLSRLLGLRLGHVTVIYVKFYLAHRKKIVAIYRYQNKHNGMVLVVFGAVIWTL